jgi:hypothetical protein
MQCMDTKLAPRALPDEEDDPAAAIERLVGLFTSGQVESATLRVNLGNGCFEEFVLGKASEADRARMLERLNEIVRSRMH